jgi:hypothetical protein
MKYIAPGIQMLGLGKSLRRNFAKPPVIVQMNG